MASVRPVVTVYSAADASAGSSVKIPAVFKAPLRSDLVDFVASQMQLNTRQAYGVSKGAGYQTAAESWGTGRAVARIPRVPGGGTHRAGQGAFGNMCRGGGMFAPTKVWRKWHRKINVTQKRHAVAAGVAATALPALVQARGHQIDEVPELPLVVSDDVQSFSKTKEAHALLKSLGMTQELDAVIKSKKIRVGKGKYRNRRYTQKKGPLVVYNNDEGIVKAFRNIPGVDLCDVNKLNLLKICPGGHLGRLTVYTQSAFNKLKDIFGNGRSSAPLKKDYVIGKSVMTNSDLHRIINSDEIQSVLNARKEGSKKFTPKKNPLVNDEAMNKLNPGHIHRKTLAKQAQTEGTREHALLLRQRAKRALQKKKVAPLSKTFFNKLKESYVVAAPEVSDVEGEDSD